MASDPMRAGLDVMSGAPCDVCGTRHLTFPYEDHGTFCSSCVLMVCGNCWCARVVEKWSTWRLRKPLLLRCPNCGWKRRIAP